MKRNISIILLLLLFGYVNAQNRKPRGLSRGSEVDAEHRSDHDHSEKVDTASHKPEIIAWTISPRLGERTLIERDTLLNDFHQKSLVDGKDVAVGYLGNIGSPAQTKIFFNRPETSRFTFLDAYRYWRKNPEDQSFLNTKIPYSNIYYQSGGGGETKEERLKTVLSSNFGKKLNMGFDLDYLYTRGFYTSLYGKQISYNFNASYIGDKYKMHAFFANNNFNNSENYGIKNDLYITNPNSQDGFGGNSLEIPVRVSSQTWNKLRGRHMYVTNRYDLGNDQEEYQVNDSTSGFRRKENFVPLASIILTTHYTDQRRHFISKNSEIDNLYKSYITQDGALLETTPKYMSPPDDYMSYYSFKNTLALAMNEGFRDWTKFGLTAFIEYDLRKYSIPNITYPMFHDREGENALLIGGVLSKEQGEFLKYKASAEKDLLNPDFKLTGEITSMFKFKEKDVFVKANAYIKNIKPSFFENKFSSKYWNLDNNFDDIRRVFIGGEISLPFTNTKLSGGVENLQNYIYYNKEGLPSQNSGSVQVVALRLDQKLNAGMFHWDNQVVYQTTTDENTIPLPMLSFYTNIYLKTKIAKVLTVQLGADAHFHTSYYAPGYDPLTIQFYNQRETKIGNFPIATAYVNLHLKYTRFFIMYYNVASGMGDSNYFSLPHYPVNPSVLKLGLSWDFNN